ncbi:MAG: enoyl-CoA hydratase-related protein [Acidobacteriota bacterium]
MTHVDVRYERHESTVKIVLDRPPLNILDLPTIGALHAAIDQAATIADALHAVVITSDLAKAFSAGVAVQDHERDQVAAMLEAFHGALVALDALPAVTLAAVRGHCLGGGMELASACDLVLASDDARFGQPEIKLGCFPPFAAARYPARIGPGATADLLLTGRTVDASEAKALGFIDRLVASEDFDNELEALLAELRAQSVPVLQITKRAIRAGRGLDAPAALAETERLYLDELTCLHDMEEGVRAFFDKRPPRWRHG